MKRILFLVFVSYSYLSFSQLTTDQKITEVFGEHYFSDNQAGYEFWVNLLENRISFTEEVYFDSEKYEKIGDAGLANKLNSSITPFNAEVFNVESFNPIRYQLDFYQSKLTKVYRIDNTNFLLIIQPQ